MRIGCPTALTEPGQIGLLGRAEKASAASGFPIDFQQTAQFEFLPQRRAQQRKEPGEAVAPLAEPAAEAQQEIQRVASATMRDGFVSRGVVVQAATKR